MNPGEDRDQRQGHFGILAALFWMLSSISCSGKVSLGEARTRKYLLRHKSQTKVGSETFVFSVFLWSGNLPDWCLHHHKQWCKLMFSVHCVYIFTSSKSADKPWGKKNQSKTTSQSLQTFPGRQTECDEPRLYVVFCLLFLLIHLIWLWHFCKGTHTRDERWKVRIASQKKAKASGETFKWNAMRPRQPPNVRLKGTQRLRLLPSFSSP